MTTSPSGFFGKIELLYFSSAFHRILGLLVSRKKQMLENRPGVPIRVILVSIGRWQSHYRVKRLASDIFPVRKSIISFVCEMDSAASRHKEIAEKDLSPFANNCVHRLVSEGPYIRKVRR